MYPVGLHVGLEDSVLHPTAEKHEGISSGTVFRVSCLPWSSSGNVRLPLRIAKRGVTRSSKGYDFI